MYEIGMNDLIGSISFIGIDSLIRIDESYKTLFQDRDTDNQNLYPRILKSLSYQII